MKTDAQLKADVMSELEWDPLVNAAKVSVEVKNGVVTLIGRIDTHAEKQPRQAPPAAAVSFRAPPCAFTLAWSSLSALMGCLLVRIVKSATECSADRQIVD